MSIARFEWSEAKNRSNQRKHGISFETAIRAFADPFALIEQDRIDEGEMRWQTLGVVDGYQVLLVAHVFIEHEDDDGSEIIRIISARKAERHERRRYAEQRR